MISPTINSVYKGQLANFNCNGITSSMMWFTSMTDKPILKFSDNFTIHNVTYLSTGEYYCYGRDIQTQKTFIARALLKVYGKEMYILHWLWHTEEIMLNNFTINTKWWS